MGDFSESKFDICKFLPKSYYKFQNKICIESDGYGIAFE